MCVKPVAPLLEQAKPKPAPPRPSFLLLDSVVSWSELRQLEPASVQAAVLFPEKIKQGLTQWVQHRLARGAGPKLALLSGPSGCGKSTFVRTVARVLGLQVMEPDILSLLDLVAAVQEDVCTGTFQLGRTSKAVPKRLWLFSGIDGYFKGSAGTSTDSSRASVRQMLDVLTHASLGLPPIVFTLHDFEGPSLQVLRTSDETVQFQASRPDCLNVSQRALCMKIVSRVCAVANQTVHTDAVTAEVMKTFDGDLKQLMLRTEFALRACVKKQKTTADFGDKDYELVDPFDTARLVYTGKTELQPEFLADVFDRYTLMETLLQLNYLAGVKQDAVGTMSAVAACADAWSTYAVMDAHWNVPQLRDIGRVHTLQTCRHYRGVMQAPDKLARSHKLAFSGKNRVAQAATMRAMQEYRSAPGTFRFNALECVERLDVMKECASQQV